MDGTMTPFVMSQEVAAELQELRALADQPDRRISLSRLKAASRDFDPGDPSKRRASIIPLDQTIMLPFGWKVTVSIEEQEIGWFIHMSVSSPAPKRVPHVATVAILMEALGFHNSVSRLVGLGLVYPENYGRGLVAINAMEPLDQDVLPNRVQVDAGGGSTESVNSSEMAKKCSDDK